MSSQKTNSTSESTWYVARRCLALVNRLQQGPTSRSTLLDEIYRQEDGAVELATLVKRFENDKQRLWDKLQIRIRYDRSVKGYIIAEWERPLFNLPDSHLKTLAFLADTFQPDTPNGSAVQDLVAILLGQMENGRRRVYDRARGVSPDIELRLRDSEEIALDVWEAVQYAYQHQQQLEFDYLSSQHADGQIRHHLVEPRGFYFTRRGHYRLRGFCLFNHGPNGRWHPNNFIHYRLSRIVPGSAKVLPQKISPLPRSIRPYLVIYELAPEIARLGISPQPELVGEPTILQMDGGWVRVESQTHDIFELARNLLYYGANCHVLGGKELLTEMRELVKGLSEVYV